MSCCYIIKCKCDKIYVGSTNRDCKKREREHNSECFNPKRRSYYSPVYTHFRNCGLERNDLKYEKKDINRKAKYNINVCVVDFGRIIINNAITKLLFINNIYRKKMKKK